jgi:hypothetical protein
MKYYRHSIINMMYQDYAVNFLNCVPILFMAHWWQNYLTNRRNGNVSKWLTSYVTNRRQVQVIKEQNSNVFKTAQTILLQSQYYPKQNCLQENNCICTRGPNMNNWYRPPGYHHHHQERRTATNRSFAIYVIQFIVSILSFGERTGCCYTMLPLLIILCLPERCWKNNRSPFCHMLHIHLISHQLFFYFPAWKKSYEGIDFKWSRDHHCHKESCTELSCKYLSAVFPAAIPTLADMHSGQWQLFEGGCWYV